MASNGECTVTVPVDWVKKTNGLAIDIGGSVAKFVYRSKDNMKEAESGTDRGHLQSVTFPRSQLSEALAYIKQHAQITRNEISDRPEIFSTGYGCMEFGKMISETLNLRLKNVTEFECFVKSLTYLASDLPRIDILEPRDEKASKLHEDQFKRKMAALALFAEETKQDLGSTDSQSPFDYRVQSVGPLDKCEHIYPCLLVIIGSGLIYLQVDEDKSFKVLDLSRRGGTTFHGVGALLTGARDFDELLELASRGNEKNLGLYTDDLLPKGTNDGNNAMYAKCAGLKEPTLIYPFAKATRATKADNFRPEDLATSWLNDCIRDICESVILWCQVTGLRRIFICGGFCSNLLIRDRLTKELENKVFLLNLKKPHTDGCIRFDFLKPELQLGAIGALIVEYEKLTQENSKIDA